MAPIRPWRCHGHQKLLPDATNAQARAVAAAAMTSSCHRRAQATCASSSTSTRAEEGHTRDNVVHQAVAARGLLHSGQGVHLQRLRDGLPAHVHPAQVGRDHLHVLRQAPPGQPQQHARFSVRMRACMQSSSRTGRVHCAVSELRTLVGRQGRGARLPGRPTRRCCTAAPTSARVRGHCISWHRDDPGQAAPQAGMVAGCGVDAGAVRGSGHVGCGPAHTSSPSGPAPAAPWGRPRGPRRAGRLAQPPRPPLCRVSGPAQQRGAGFRQGSAVAGRLLRWAQAVHSQCCQATCAATAVRAQSVVASMAF